MPRLRYAMPLPRRYDIDAMQRAISGAMMLLLTMMPPLRE